MLKELWNKYKDMIPYAFFGVLTTLVNIITFDVLWHFLGWNYQFANVLAYWLSVLFAYVTNKLWVFNSHTATWKDFFKEMVSFFLFRAASWVIDQSIMTIGVSLLHGNALIVKILDNVVVIILNYVFSKFIIFRKRNG
ncbi:teichoic acid glycosylation protein [Companilactobacillus paralimentarius DSM 13238 = JCM 10415]|jgi:Predicted membrane protein|uniref:Teichoic acid glycosylation protein n=1 Tax=Companilactobacillus paralimentarius DSM 13238 = JCM 10415 TaxID=1122151 RepID=A0A0R1PJD1_9LACO|nr:GtrA family protein [Companilactobacillus paralimentarius]KAE9563862.1 teichoic acid glycosylation protein [Companilactobacillus paralimentarius]KRL32397.1 teichoic acid glycosylation protein [Companilactobacillus paralimentarius DSM 13238 = JCM 10415]MDR4932843.1 GtrA family protein [Companilactobacillus paralimentarius]QFR69391.1 GtrA family protein [Companilactobacillus paralimentarius]